MRKLSRLSALLIAGAVMTAPVMAADKAKALATVNGQPISQAVFDTIVAEQTSKGVPDTPQLRESIKDQLIARELLVQESKRKGFDKKSEIQLQIEAARQAVLVNALLTDTVRSNPVSDAQLKAEYDLIKQNLGGTEYRSRHILVESEAEAKAIIAKLNKGEKIADLAKDSKDPGSRETGGDLGWSTPGSYVKPFADALVSLKKGEFTKDPVQSQFGWHVIQLEDTRDLTPPPFEQIRPQLLQRANQQKVESLVQELRKKAKIN